MRAVLSPKATESERLGRLNLTALEDRQDNFKDEHRSFLARHLPQVEWIKEHLKQAITEKLDSSHGGHGPAQGLTAIVLGASTGEECVRLFYELSQIKGKGDDSLLVRVHGVDVDGAALKEADRRIRGRSALNGTLRGPENEYARDMIRAINHSDMRSRLVEGIKWHNEDVSRTDELARILNDSQRSLTGPSIVFLNHTLRIFKPSSQPSIVSELSHALPESILAIGDSDLAIGAVKNLPEHAIIRPNIREDLTSYVFALPVWTDKFFPEEWA